MTTVANPHSTLLPTYGDHSVDGLTDDDHFAMAAGGMVTHTYGNSMDDAGGCSPPRGDSSPQFAHHKLLEDTEFASHFEGLSARSDQSSPTPSHTDPNPSPLTSNTPRIPSPAHQQRDSSLEPPTQHLTAAAAADQESHHQSSQHSSTHQQQQQQQQEQEQEQHIISHTHQLQQQQLQQQQQQSDSFNFEASIKIEHSPSQQLDHPHHLQNQASVSASHQDTQNGGYSSADVDLADASDYISRDSYSTADVAGMQHALPSMADMCDPNAAGSAVHSHQSQARCLSTYLANEGLTPRQPRSRAQTFAFGSHLPFNNNNNSPSTFGLSAVYSYPNFSADRAHYSAPSSPYDSLPPLATVPEHSLASLATTSVHTPLTQQEQMFTLQPQFPHEDNRVLQIRQQFSFPDHTDHSSSQQGQHHHHHHQQQQQQQQPATPLGNGHRSPLIMNRQRSSSDQIMRPSPLLVDVNTLHRRSSTAMSYTGSLMTPIGSPHPDSPYDAMGFPLMSTHLLPMGDHHHHHHHHHQPHLNGSYGGNGTGFLNPAHLSQQPPPPPPPPPQQQQQRRQRAPSAPMISTSHTFFNGTSSLASPGPMSAAAASVGTPTSGSPVFHQNTMHALPSDMHPPIMNPVDEEFKRRILQLKFEEREIAIDFLKEQAKQTGFSVLVRTSRPDYVVIICNCGRRVKQVEGERKRKRKRKTAMTGCEWHVILFRRNIPGSTAPRMWEYRASSKMEHNHPLNLNDD
ncbi:hypothetical protein HDU86_005510 [Geranomyces michiganensis]|nr:hypothetical protein HDU86_005510 [Geranomyces michiganensis]